MPLLDLGVLNYRGDDLTIGAVGNIVLFTVALLTSLFIAPAKSSERTGTVWHWRELRNARQRELSSGAAR